MPVAIHAVVVIRVDARVDSAAHLSETLTALRAQAHPVNALTLVVCGESPQIRAIAAGSGATAVITAPASTGFAAAVRMASGRLSPEQSLWLLAQDTVPEPDALQHLAARLETSLSVAVVAPKLVRASDHSVLESVGVTMTQLGRAITIGTGQIDQGQHDGTEDILGSDIRGILIRADQVKTLLPDPALAGADEGLDIGVRARVRALRVDLASSAIVAVAGDGVAGMPIPLKPRDRRRIAYATRVAQLHRRLAYAPAWAVALHILSFPFLALWRTMQHLVDKLPARVLPEWGGTILVATRWPSIARSRRAVGGSRAGFKRVAPLRLTRRQVKAVQRLSSSTDVVSHKTDLRFFSGGGAWVTLAAFALSVVLFPALLAWPSIAGGALLPLRQSLSQLWADTQYGYHGIGLDQAGPADPFAAVVAVLGSLSPTNPSAAIVWLWVLALPLAVLGGWFAATRVTERSGLRIAAAIAWACAPMFLSALMTPRPAAVTVHLLLPWLWYAALIVHRSWGAAGAASITLLAVAAASPSLGIVLVALSIVAAIAFICFGRLQAMIRFVWVIVPTLVWFAPLVWRNVVSNTPLASLADPGAVFGGSRADDSLWGRLQTASGFPDNDPAGWGAFLEQWHLSQAAPFIILLVAPLFLLALAAPFLARWRVGSALVLSGTVLTIAAVGVTHLAVAFTQEGVVAIWPGALLSAAFLVVVLAAMLVLDTPGWQRAARSAVATVATLLIVLSAVPTMTAPARGVAQLGLGTSTTLPAFVAAEAASDPGVGTLILTPRGNGSVSTRIAWGGSDTLGSESSLVNTRVANSKADESLATTVASIITPGAGGSVSELSDLGVRFVLIRAATEGGQSAAVRAGAIASLDLRAGLSSVGETGKGALWRVDAAPSPREALTQGEKSVGMIIAVVNLAVIVIALLFAIPTPTSVRASRRRPRLVDARGVEEV